MPHPASLRLLLRLAAGLCLALVGVGPLPAAAPAPARWAHIRTGMFFTSPDVDTLLGTPEARTKTLAYFAPLRLSKVYLEDAQGDPADVAKLRDIAAALKAQGLEVAGAVVPNDHGPLCYNNPANLATLENRVRVLAAVFDEIIVDDWLFTICTCDKCLAGRGDASWADYRSQLVAEQSKLHLVGAAKQVRADCRVIIKYPNWYEGHRQHGYDVARQTPQFDGVSVGIETRQRATHDQHIPIYSGYVFQKWIGGDAGAKWRSAWLDNYGMQGDDHDYIAQVWQAVLARTPEILFWCAGQLHPPTPASDVYAHLVESMPDFDRVAGLLDGPARGIPIHLPLGSVGEYNLFGHLGMIGLPLTPVTTFPVAAQTAIFSKHSLRDPQLAAELLARVHAGKEVFLTWPLLQSLPTSELARAFNLIDTGGSATGATFRVQEHEWDAKTVEAPRAFTFPKLATSIWPYVREIALLREDADLGVLLKTPYLEGRVSLLNLPDNLYDLQRLPAPVLNILRRSFLAELGVTLRGPGGVALYPFGEKQYVVYNLSDTAAEVALRFPEGTPAQQWTERIHGKQLRATVVEETVWDRKLSAPEVALTLQPFELALVERD